MPPDMPPKKKKTVKKRKAGATRVQQSHYRPDGRTLRVFGAAMRRERERLELTTTALSKRLGISQSSWSRIEGGSREPSLEMLRKINQLIPVTGYVACFLRTGAFEENSEVL